MPEGENRRSVSRGSSQSSSADTPNGTPAGPDPSGGFGTEDDDSFVPQVELRHFIDPFDGSYKAKLSLPKNFKGPFYIAGLNLSSLSDKNLYVRFYFGRERYAVETRAIVGRGDGITQFSDIDVLIIDMDDRPFEGINLFYDLYDYNDYEGDTEEPTQDNRDPGLYCRGLRLEDDSTFKSTSSDFTCDEAGEKCLYSYAKIVDSGLYYNAGANVYVPSEPQAEIGDSGLNDATERSTYDLFRCLPDNDNASHLYSLFGIGVGAFPNYNTAFNGQIYRGPFRAINTSNWEISDNALISNITGPNDTPLGLYKEVLTGAALSDYPDAGFGSFLFPRAGKLQVKSGVEYFGDTDPFDPRTSTITASAGETQFMDGCNLRVTSYDKVLGEHMGSCNVTATIEVFTKESGTGDETILASSKELKLQLVRASKENYQGLEVLFTSLNKCSSSNQCGSGSCCFNERCWSEDLVSQCVEESTVIGNKGTGESCSSDYQCASLCCNQSSSTCSPHIYDENSQVLCGKAPNQQCVSKEFCAQQTVRECYIVRTGLDASFNPTCELRCYNVAKFGDCVSGRCVAPSVPSVPAFDPANPDCSSAVDPSTLPVNATP